MDQVENGDPISLKRVEANRRNAQLSTGPRTEEGKARSRYNALKHGVLASALLITEGAAAEYSGVFQELLDGLRQDLAPVGMLEEILVEKIAVCCWRQRRALQCEAAIVREDEILPMPMSKGLLKIMSHRGTDRILRYETTIHRQLAFAMNQLERLQRTRKGENVPAPVTVQLSSDQ
jgi:hypothetical protein